MLRARWHIVSSTFNLCFEDGYSLVERQNDEEKGLKDLGCLTDWLRKGWRGLSCIYTLGSECLVRSESDSIFAVTSIPDMLTLAVPYGSEVAAKFIPNDLAA